MTLGCGQKAWVPGIPASRDQPGFSMLMRNETLRHPSPIFVASCSGIFRKLRDGASTKLTTPTAGATTNKQLSLVLSGKR